MGHAEDDLPLDERLELEAERAEAAEAAAMEKSSMQV